MKNSLDLSRRPGKCILIEGKFSACLVAHANCGQTAGRDLNSELKLQTAQVTYHQRIGNFFSLSSPGGEGWGEEAH